MGHGELQPLEQKQMIDDAPLPQSPSPTTHTGRRTLEIPAGRR